VTSHLSGVELDINFNGFMKDMRIIVIIDEPFYLEAVGGPRVSNKETNTEVVGYSEMKTRSEEVIVDGDSTREVDGFRFSSVGLKNMVFCDTEWKERSELGIGSRDRSIETTIRDRRICEIKPWNRKRNSSKMVLDRDVGLQEVSSLSLCSLVGRFNYYSLSKFDIS